MRKTLAMLVVAVLATLLVASPASAAPPGGLWLGGFGTNADGRLEAFAVDGAGTLWHNFQSNGWSGWLTMGQPGSSGVWDGPVVVRAPGPQGYLEVFVINTLGDLYSKIQDGNSPTGWSDWRKVYDFRWAGNLSVQSDAYGVYIAVTGDEQASLITWIGGTVSTKRDFGAPPGDPLSGSVQLGRNSDGRWELFTVGDSGADYHLWQKPDGGWSGWAAYPRCTGGAADGLAVATNQDKRLELFATSTGDLCHLWQDPNQSGGWSGWNDFGDGTIRNDFRAIHAITGDDVGAPNNRIEVYAMRSNGTLVGKWQQSPNGNWISGFSAIGSGFDGNFAVGKNGDGRLELLAFRNGVPYHTWQVGRPGGGWNSWVVLDQG
ncbi:hypothetical protein ACQP2F_02820 [Actinoplanes sp. CA-030573]|uniref:hypothetical protein n=1 Tax=Actinoplanes sp. CA-030573 TaxID=3239898 RepID=UPI003D8A1BB9